MTIIIFPFQLVPSEYGLRITRPGKYVLWRVSGMRSNRDLRILIKVEGPGTVYRLIRADYCRHVFFVRFFRMVRYRFYRWWRVFYSFFYFVVEYVELACSTCPYFVSDVRPKTRMRQFEK